MFDLVDMVATSEPPGLFFYLALYTVPTTLAQVAQRTSIHHHTLMYFLCNLRIVSLFLSLPLSRYHTVRCILLDDLINQSDSLKSDHGKRDQSSSNLLQQAAKFGKGQHYLPMYNRSRSIISSN